MPLDERVAKAFPGKGLPVMNCQEFPCNCRGEGEQAVEFKMTREGPRWFITMGHAGFNTQINNRMGYGSKAAARRIIQKYQSR